MSESWPEKELALNAMQKLMNPYDPVGFRDSVMKINDYIIASDRNSHEDYLQILHFVGVQEQEALPEVKAKNFCKIASALVELYFFLKSFSSSIPDSSFIDSKISDYKSKIALEEKCRARADENRKRILYNFNVKPRR